MKIIKNTILRITGASYLVKVVALFFSLGLSFISGGVLVYTGIAQTIKDSIDNQIYLFISAPPAEGIITAGTGIKNATNYLKSVNKKNWC